MLYRYSDYCVGSTPYRIRIFVTPLTVKDFFRIVEKFKYYCRRDGVSWMIVYSTTDSDTATPKTIRTGKRGRPKKVVDGEKVDAHIHCLLVGNQRSAYQTALAIKQSIDRTYNNRGVKKCRVESIGNGLHLYNTLDYNYRQGDIIRTGGDFDFQDYYDKCRECELFG